jgi:microsomal dipeptidase-like Zn-dependent dipeptidase
MSALSATDLIRSFDLEGTVALGDQLSMVELYYELGVRWMLMAYNKKNSVGGSITSTRSRRSRRSSAAITGGWPAPAGAECLC